MLRAYKYRIYPTRDQEQFFERTFGCVRFYWNKALEIKPKVFEEGRGKSKEKRKPIPEILPSQLKRDYPFLKEVDSFALANAQLNLERAFELFFKGKAEISEFKRKKSRQSYTTNNVSNSIRVDFEKGYIRVPKIGLVKVKIHRTFEGRIKSATIEKTTTSKYYVSVLVETDTIKPLPETDRVCAIDLGLKDFAVISYSDGTVERIENPGYLNRTLKRLAREQRKLSRKQKGSKNGEKQRLTVAKLHEKIENQREDFLHKVSKRIVCDNQAIILESLNVQGLISNGNLSRHITDTSWSKFVEFLTYKAQWYGRELIFADSFHPSSKLCHMCGYKKQDLTLSVRNWMCSLCGTEHDRDVDASKNLLDYGFIHLTDDRVGTT